MFNDGPPCRFFGLLRRPGENFIMQTSNSKSKNANTALAKNNNFVPPQSQRGRGQGARTPKAQANAQDAKRAPKKSKKPKKKQDNSPGQMSLGGLTPTCFQKHVEVLKYLKAMSDVNIRGVLPPWTSNPIQTSMAIPFYTEITFRDTAGPGVCVTHAFPLGYTTDYQANSMDGSAFHSNYILSSAGVQWATGPAGYFDYTGAFRNPAASLRYAVAGQEVIGSDFTLYGGTTWDYIFPMAGNSQPANFSHRRWAMVGAELSFYNDTPIGDRGGFFNVFEPQTRALPMASNGTSVGSGTSIRELPTFKTLPADERAHTHKVQGRDGSRAYWHNDGPNAVSIGDSNNKNCGLYLQFNNTTATTQSFGYTLRVTWAVGGQNADIMGIRAPDGGVATGMVQNAVKAANSGAVPVTGLVSDAVNGIVAPAARMALNAAIGAAKAPAGLAAFSPSSLIQMVSNLH